MVLMLLLSLALFLQVHFLVDDGLEQEYPVLCELSLFLLPWAVAVVLRRGEHGELIH